MMKYDAREIILKYDARATTSHDMQSDACILHEKNQKSREIANDGIFDKFHSYIRLLAALRE